jgi:hypothetical protein
MRIAGLVARLRPRGDAEQQHQSREFARLARRRLATAVIVDQPLVLISQVQRSGGTLLSQLFDGHPECHAHPYELKIGPNKSTWPHVEPGASAETWWDLLRERDVRRLFLEGYAKHSTGLAAQLDDQAQLESFPFLLPPRLQRRLFFDLVETRRPATGRQVIDCYLTSYFNGWLDNQNLYSGPKRIVTGFTPRLVAGEGSVDRFFRDYPDGRLVSLIREPKSWYASATRHDPTGYPSLEGSIELWLRSTRAALDARARHGAQTIVLTYERLVTGTETVMRGLAASVGIEFLPSLLEPTFNGLAIRADSAFEIAGPGIVTSPLERGANELEPTVQKRIDAAARELYDSVAALV